MTKTKARETVRAATSTVHRIAAGRGGVTYGFWTSLGTPNGFKRNIDCGSDYRAALRQRSEWVDEQVKNIIDA